jgi:hypothetical protein
LESSLRKVDFQNQSAEAAGVLSSKFVQEMLSSRGPKEAVILSEAFYRGFESLP